MTLVEVLVVIAIILVLAAIILPVTSRVRIAGERTVAVSNTRQIAQAMLVYASSNNDVFPVSGFLPTGYWLAEIGLVRDGRPTLKDPRFYYRPEPRYVPNYSSLAGYARNACMRHNRPYQSIVDVARTVLIAPVTFWDVNGPGYHTADPTVALAWPDTLHEQWIKSLYPGAVVKASEPLGSQRYFGNGVYAFIDGHIKTLAPEEFFIPEGQAPGRPRPDICGYDGVPQPKDDGMRPTFSIRSAAPGTTS